MNQPCFEDLGELNGKQLIDAFELMKKNEEQSIKTIKDQLDRIKNNNLTMTDKVGKIIRGQDEKN
jgi:hypothetical protein